MLPSQICTPNNNSSTPTSSRLILCRADAATVYLEGAHVDPLSLLDHVVHQIILWDSVPNTERKQQRWSRPLFANLLIAEF